MSNDQERAWYDSHRDQILRGKDVGDEATEDDCSYLTKKKLDRFFQNNCFAGFAMSGQGNDFFSVYGELFAKLDKEEEDEEEVGAQHYAQSSFGNEDSKKEEVYGFYRDWEGFSTIKKFTFVDVYDPREAPNRRIKRLIETENNRARKREQNKFNDKVKELVTHVKRLDPRWQAFQAEDQQAREERRRQIEEEKRLKSAQEAERLRQYREDLAEFYRKEEEEALLRGEVEEVVEEHYRCQPCKKSFKKEGQFNNHVQSKQHKKVLAAIKDLRKGLELDDETEAANADAQKKLTEQLAKAREETEREKATHKSDGETDSDPESIELRKKRNKVLGGGQPEEQKLAEPDLDDLDEWTHKTVKKNKKKKVEKNVGEKHLKELMREANHKRKAQFLKEIDKKPVKKNKHGPNSKSSSASHS